MTDENIKANIAANVRRFRGERSKAWLARESMVEAMNISRIERGETMPGAAMLKRLADALKVSTDQLLAPPFLPPPEGGEEKKPD